MELDDRIGEDVAHVDLAALLLDQRMLVHHEPADVRKEEAPVRVVRIGVRLRVFVVHPVVAHPVVDGVLAGHGEAQGENDAQRQFCLVRPVRPHAMHTARHPEAANAAHNEACERLGLETVQIMGIHNGECNE